MLKAMAYAVCLEWGMIPSRDEFPIFFANKDGKEHSFLLLDSEAEGAYINFYPTPKSVEDLTAVLMYIRNKAGDNLIVFKPKPLINSLTAGRLSGKDVVDKIIYKNRIDLE
jgi:hypothetical protein